ncbi:hypothetical protein COHA_001027 [Chlorella ohadii]|uniref:Uncharacterized protein n=1 Tax=Chlorella ohadii TaxID=2649997 RepID=A0AAD5H5X1_9CHLO|nr:hypothetical protein COHA_001027 [Chlorella ohadii]
MKWTTDLYLKGLGVLELVENAQQVVEDWLHRKRGQHGGLAGKTAIVTGGNAGVGYATAEALLARGCSVVLAVRDRGRGDAAAARLAATAAGSGGSQQLGGRQRKGGSSGGQQAGGAAAQGSTAGGGPQQAEAAPEQPEAAQVAVEILDLAILSSVRAFAERWKASGRSLDLLVCNAGIMVPPERTITADGFELQFQSNYLGHFLLANLLVRQHQRQHAQHAQQPAQRASGAAGGSQGSGSGSSGPLRVLFLSSMTHIGGDLSDLTDVPYCRRPPWNTFAAYCNSKLCTLLAAKHMDRLLARAAPSGDGKRDAAVAVHPGLVNTALAAGYFKQMPPKLLRPLTDPFFTHVFCPYMLRSPEAAAETVLYAATAPADEVGGRYCGTAPRVTRHSAAADDPQVAQRLWDLSAHLCQLDADDLVS